MDLFKENKDKKTLINIFFVNAYKRIKQNYNIIDNDSKYIIANMERFCFYSNQTFKKDRISNDEMEKIIYDEINEFFQNFLFIKLKIIGKEHIFIQILNIVWHSENDVFVQCIYT